MNRDTVFIALGLTELQFTCICLDHFLKPKRHYMFAYVCM